jgi:8-oxo-dGTP pyrophosphatase MutT (NUDIX family)
VTGDPLKELLARYRAGTDTERADLVRIRERVERGEPWLRSTPLHLTASALIVHPSTGRVLLRWHQRQQAWLHVGGHADAGEEDPIAIALREGREETGLDDLTPWPDAGLVHVAVVPVAANAHEPAHEHADLRFMLATDRPETARPEKPTAPLRWLDLDAARTQVAEPNLRETLTRVERLLDANGVAATNDGHPIRSNNG